MRQSVSGSGIPDSPGMPIYLIVDDRNDGIIRSTMIPESAHAVLLKHSHLSLRITYPYFRGSIYSRSSEIGINNLSVGYTYRDKSFHPVEPMEAEFFTDEWQKFRETVFEEVYQFEHLFQYLMSYGYSHKATLTGMADRYQTTITEELKKCDPSTNTYSPNLKMYASYQTTDLKTCYEELKIDIDSLERAQMQTLAIWHQIVEKAMNCNLPEEWKELKIYLKLMLLNGGGTNRDE